MGKKIKRTIQGYRFDGDIPPAIKQEMSRAMSRIEAVCGVRFKQVKKSDKTAFRITHEEYHHPEYKAWWWVEPHRKALFPRKARLNTCQNVGAPNFYRLCLHELCHVLGLYHRDADPSSIMHPTVLVDDLSDQDVKWLWVMYPL